MTAVSTPENTSPGTISVAALLAVAVMVAATFVGAPGAQAEEVGAPEAPEHAVLADDNLEPAELTTQQQADVEAVSAAIDRESGVLMLLLLETGLSEQGIADVAAVVDGMGGEVRGEAPIADASEEVGAMASTMSTCTASYNQYYIPWGHQWILDSCATDRLIAAVGLGAAALIACQTFGSTGGIYLNAGGTPPVSCWGR